MTDRDDSSGRTRPNSDVAFTDTVKEIQTRKGSRAGYARMEEKGGWRDRITEDLAAFLASRDSFYLSTANAAGHPYIQHRGGMPGFIRVLDDKTFAFADFKGNRQYITQGNLAENPQAFIFLMDYPNRRRIKIWGRAHVVEDDADLVAELMVPGYEAEPEQAIVFEITAWDSNCPQHIMPRYTHADVVRTVAPLKERIAELEARLAAAGLSPDLVS